MLTFDDLPIFPKASGGVQGSYFDNSSLITDYTYQGFRFANENGSRWFWNPETNATGEPFAGVGGSTWVGVNTDGDPAGASDNFSPAITSVVDFTFDGAFFTGYDPIQFKLYLNGNLVKTTSCVLPGTQTPIFCGSQYGGLVDQVVIENLTPATERPSAWYAMDNFTYNTAAPVPEPGTHALMVGSLAALLLASRRRKKAA